MTPPTLGSYPIERELGRGGMGVVYLGHDRRLDRPVAIKVLSAALAAHPDHLTRFEREARTLASVSHPNIASIYGVEQTAAGEPLLVLEYVPGETLADRLARGPLGTRDALEYGVQIASAIEAAHDRGIIHRDLKPGNVKITPDGQIKVLDFGLAKGTAGPEGVDMAQSPTFTSPATAAGVILGTAGYMSPEQARGRVVDKRSDIWSFGCVLLECLTGVRAFDGETVSDTIAHILQREPDWSKLPADTPPRVRDLLRRCLEKDLRRRQRDIGDVRLEIEDALSDAGALPSAVPVRVAGGPRATALLVAGALVAGTVLGAGLWAGLTRDRAVVAPAPLRLTVTFPSNLSVRDYRIAPDGKRLIVRASAIGAADQRVRLYGRPLESYEATPIPGTEGVERFVFSPDGRSIALLVRVDAATGEKRLLKAPIDGSAPPVTLAHWDRRWFDSFIWLEDGDLLLSRSEGNDQVIFRVSSITGEVKPPVKLTLGRSGIVRTLGRRWREDGVFVQVDNFGARGYQTNIWLIDPATGTGTEVVEDAAEPYHLESGHLLFTRGGTIMAARFDAATRAIAGELTAVLSGLDSPVGPASFSLADDGTLTYITGTGGLLVRGMVVLEPQGKIVPFVSDTGRFAQDLALSPDGRRATVTVLNAGATYEIWIADATLGTIRRTIAPATADVTNAVWSRDGQSLAFYREGLDGQDGIHMQRADGSGEVRRIAPSASTQNEFLAPTSWLADASALVVTRSVAQNSDLGLLRLAEGDAVAKYVTLRATPHNEQNGVVSPDGKLLAFSSNESGQMEIYIAPFDGRTIGTPLPVSRGACPRARWMPASRRLYFCDAAGRLMSVDVTLTPALAFTSPSPVHDLGANRLLNTGWDVDPGGRIVAIQRASSEDALPSINIAFGWLAEIRTRLPR
jgi:WD40 repeat protein